ncbi:unnamed protein product, partial [Rotaria sordida]
FYRVYNHEQEVKTLIQFGLNQLKNNGQLPIVADYTTFALNKNTGSEYSVNTGSQQSSLTAATTRLTPTPDHLRVRTNGNAAASSSSSLSQPAVASRLIKSKFRASVAKKRGRISENEENDENNDDTPILH